MANDADRTYQRSLIAEADAEMGRQRISRRELSRMTGMSRVTLDRIFTMQRDMNVTQWETIAHALGVDPGELAARAGHVSVTPPKSEDPRTLITWLLQHPEDDAELVTRLDEVAHQTALSGRRLANIMETIRTVRREELEQALGVLPPHTPSPSRADQSG